jgi:hypothetical protein
MKQSEPLLDSPDHGDAVFPPVNGNRDPHGHDLGNGARAGHASFRGRAQGVFRFWLMPRMCPNSYAGPYAISSTG